jgi:hypothetical protein
VIDFIESSRMAVRTASVQIVIFLGPSGKLRVAFNATAEPLGWFGRVIFCTSQIEHARR